MEIILILAFFKILILKHTQIALKDQNIGLILFISLQEQIIPVKILLFTVLSKFV